jgi:hypothetical protein
MSRSVASVVSEVTFLDVAVTEALYSGDTFSIVVALSSNDTFFILEEWIPDNDTGAGTGVN